MSIVTLNPAIQSVLSQQRLAVEKPLSGEEMLFSAMLKSARASALSNTALATGVPLGTMPLTPYAWLSLRRALTDAMSRKTGTEKDVPCNARTGETDTGIGSLAARFESGGDGVAAVGYDTGGGTSYGRYQIASRPGTMNRFLDFLDSRAPEWADRLRSAGSADTGSRNGAMPDAWRAIATEDPDRFEHLQQAFIRETHYLPAAQRVFERTGLSVEDRSDGLKEVLWSTAVQHGAGGAAAIFADALASLENKGGEISDDAIVQQVYQERRQRVGGLAAPLRNALEHRFDSEETLALRMLADQPVSA